MRSKRIGRQCDVPSSRVDQLGCLIVAAKADRVKLAGHWLEAQYAGASDECLAAIEGMDHHHRRIIERSLTLMFTDERFFFLSIARRWSNVMPVGCELDDLVSLAELGAIEQLDSFDPSKGSFSTHATWGSVRTIRRFLGEQSTLLTVRHDTYFQMLGDPELPDDLGSVRRHTLLCVRVAIESRSRVRSMARVPAREESYSPEQDEIRSRLVELIDRLPAQERDVVRKSFGLNGHDPEGYASISEGYGVSKQRIGQIRQSAIRRLRGFASVSVA